MSKFEEIKKKYDKAMVGAVLGSLLPFLGFVISKMVKGSHVSWTQYWNIFLSDSDYKIEILILSMMPNMLLFYFFLFQWKLDHASKGLVGATLIFCILILAFV